MRFCLSLDHLQLSRSQRYRKIFFKTEYFTVRMDAEGYGSLKLCFAAAQDMYPFFIYMFPRQSQWQKEKGIDPGNFV